MNRKCDYTFFKNKKILVTGHNGFIGTWLTEWLLTLNAEVCGYSLEPPSSPNLFNILETKDDILDIKGDIRNKSLLSNAISAFSPEIVFHLAAQPIVLDSYIDPSLTFDVNVNGTVNLLNELRNSKNLNSIIIMTSDKVYRNNEWFYPYREIDHLGGADPYSASKSCQDIVVNSFANSFFKKRNIMISSVRAGNVVGGGDFANHRIIPDIVRSILQKGTVKLRNPDSIRPWQHVLEPIRAMLMLSMKGNANNDLSGPWNFGPEQQSVRTVRELTEKFIMELGSGQYKVERDISNLESSHLQIDISKARTQLGWSPTLDFDRMLAMTSRWYKAFIENQQNLKALTSNQIKEFERISNNQ